MGTRRSSEPGPAARRVRNNLRQLRDEKHVSLRDLSKILEQQGHPILASGLSKIETGDRRADVDDLIAIALALDVVPNRLLLTKTADERQIIELTPGIETSERAAWNWATGDAPLSPNSSTSRFIQENRPHDPPDETPLEDVEKHEDILAPAVKACREAIEQSGLSRETVLTYVSVALRLFAFLGDRIPRTEES